MFQSDTVLVKELQVQTVNHRREESVVDEFDLDCDVQPEGRESERLPEGVDASDMRHILVSPGKPELKVQDRDDDDDAQESYHIVEIDGEDFEVVKADGPMKVLSHYEYRVQRRST